MCALVMNCHYWDICERTSLSCELCWVLFIQPCRCIYYNMRKNSYPTQKATARQKELARVKSNRELEHSDLFHALSESTPHTHTHSHSHTHTHTHTCAHTHSLCTPALLLVLQKMMEKDRGHLQRQRPFPQD